MEKSISFEAWADNPVEYLLDFREREFEGDRALTDILTEHEISPPRVALPSRGLDCLTLDNLKDHPIVDVLTRKQMDDGVPFRLVRVPFSLMPSDKTRITKARLNLRLENSEKMGARIHSIYPMKVEVGKEVSSEIALDPKLSFAGSFEISAGRIVKNFKVQQSQSLITGFWGEDGADWILKPFSDDDGLEGTWDFLAIIRWLTSVKPLPISVEVEATVTPTARHLFWPTKRISHRYNAWDGRACVTLP